MKDRAYKMIREVGADQAMDTMLGLLQEASDGNVAGLAWDFRYSESVRNTHAAPRGKPTNWHCRDDLPRGYPGFEGRVWIMLYQPCVRPFHASDLVSKFCMRTGTGGFGSYSGPWRQMYSDWHQALRSARDRASTYEGAQRIDRQFRRRYPEPQVYSWHAVAFSDDWAGVHRDLAVPELRRIARQRLAGHVEDTIRVDWKEQYSAPDLQERFPLPQAEIA